MLIYLKFLIILLVSLYIFQISSFLTFSKSVKFISRNRFARNLYLHQSNNNFLLSSELNMLISRIKNTSKLNIGNFISSQSILFRNFMNKSKNPKKTQKINFESSYQNFTEKETFFKNKRSSNITKYRFPVGEARDLRFPENIDSKEMEITFLGTSSAFPTASRGTSCIALRFNANLWLFDCGESTQSQFHRASLRAHNVKKIFITHNHGDHIFGLPAVLCMLGISFHEHNSRVEDSADRLNSIEIYGPEGIRNYIRTTLQTSVSKISIPYRVHELKNIPYLHGQYAKPFYPNSFEINLDPRFGEKEGGMDIYPDKHGIYHICDDGALTVKAAPLQHSIPCVGYVVTENDRQRNINITPEIMEIVENNKDAIIKKYGYPNHKKIFSRLKNMQPGETFIFPDGTKVESDDIFKPASPNRKVVILGDTCSSEKIVPLAKNPDILIHEATNTYLDDLDKIQHGSYENFEKNTIIHGHSTSHMAGKFSKKLGAKKLILTHFSSRYNGNSNPNSMEVMWKIEDIAKKSGNYKNDNDVIAAWDFMKIPVLKS